MAENPSTGLDGDFGSFYPIFGVFLGIKNT